MTNFTIPHDIFKARKHKYRYDDKLRSHRVEIGGVNQSSVYQHAVNDIHRRRIGLKDLYHSQPSPSPPAEPSSAPGLSTNYDTRVSGQQPCNTNADLQKFAGSII